MAKLRKAELESIRDRYSTYLSSNGLLQPENPLYRCDEGGIRLVSARSRARTKEIEVQPGTQLIWHDPDDGQTYFAIYITTYGDTVLIDTFHRGNVEVFDEELRFYSESLVIGEPNDAF